MGKKHVLEGKLIGNWGIWNFNFLKIGRVGIISHVTFNAESNDTIWKSIRSLVRKLRHNLWKKDEKYVLRERAQVCTFILRSFFLSCRITLNCYQNLGTLSCSRSPKLPNSTSLRTVKFFSLEHCITQTIVSHVFHTAEQIIPLLFQLHWADEHSHLQEQDICLTISSGAGDIYVCTIDHFRLFVRAVVRQIDIRARKKLWYRSPSTIA